MRSLAVPAAAVLVLCACRSAPDARSEFQYRAGLKPDIYFPLTDGAVWSYRASIAGGASDLLVINKVASHEGNRFTVSPDLAYEAQGDAVVRLPSGTIVLRTPIESGASWPIPDGTASIVAVDGVAETPAGRFKSCVVVEEKTTDRRHVTRFAPGVGPVQEEIYSRGPGGEVLYSRALLQSFATGSEAP